MIMKIIVAYCAIYILLFPLVLVVIASAAEDGVYVPKHFKYITLIFPPFLSLYIYYCWATGNE